MSATDITFEIVELSTKYLFPTAAKIAPIAICDLESKSFLGI